MFVYLIANHETGKYYVGQHKGNNLKQYLQKKFYEARHYLSRRSRLYASMRKHGREAFTIHALLFVQTRAELDQKEKDFITFLKSQDPEYGYNICRGGEGFTGPHTKKNRKKIMMNLNREGSKHRTTEQNVSLCAEMRQHRKPHHSIEARQKITEANIARYDRIGRKNDRRNVWVRAYRAKKKLEA